MDQLSSSNPRGAEASPSFPRRIRPLPARRSARNGVGHPQDDETERALWQRLTAEMLERIVPVPGVAARRMVLAAAAKRTRPLEPSRRPRSGRVRADRGGGSRGVLLLLWLARCRARCRRAARRVWSPTADAAQARQRAELPPLRAWAVARSRTPRRRTAIGCRPHR